MLRISRWPEDTVSRLLHSNAWALRISFPDSIVCSTKRVHPRNSRSYAARCIEIRGQCTHAHYRNRLHALCDLSIIKDANMLFVQRRCYAIVRCRRRSKNSGTKGSIRDWFPVFRAFFCLGKRSPCGFRTDSVGLIEWQDEIEL